MKMADIVSDEENEFAVPKFTIDGEITRQYRRFNAVGIELTVRLLPPARGDDSDDVTHFQASVTELFDYALRNCRDSDMVGLTIRNEVNMQEKAKGISFRRKDQLVEEVIWSVFNKVAQSNVRFNALDKLVVVLQSIKIPVGFGRKNVRSKGRPVDEMVHLKRSIIQVKAKKYCLAHALIIAIARITNDPVYNSYRQGCKIFQKVQHLLQTTGIDLQYGEVFKNSRDSKITFQRTEL